MSGAVRGEWGDVGGTGAGGGISEALITLGVGVVLYNDVAATVVVCALVVSCVLVDEDDEEADADADADADDGTCDGGI